MKSDRPANAFLRRLSDATWEQIQPNLARVDLNLGEPLHRPADRVDAVYFPVSTLLSILTSTLEGDTVETAMVGNDGALGVLEACGSGRTAMLSLVQVNGVAFKMPAATFRRLVMADEDLGAAAWTLIESQITESRQSGMCQALHGVEARLARWLGESMERCGGRNPMPLTQDFVASMLGVQRTTVTTFATQLQKSGLIRYQRGKVEIVDPAGLEHRACECRSVLKEQRARLGFQPLQVGEAAARRA